MLVLSSPLGMCMQKHSGTLENLLLPQIAHSLRVCLRVCFSALKKQCYSMLIQLLYIQSTEPFPFYRRITIQEMSGIWVFRPIHPTGVQHFPRYRDWWARPERLLKTILLCTTGAPGIPRWAGLEAFGAPKVADKIPSKYWIYLK